MIEKFWRTVGPFAFTAAGSARGKIQLAAENACHFRVKMRVRVSTGSTLVELEVKRVNSDTELEVGPLGKINLRADLTAFPIGSLIIALEQPRNDIPLQEISRAVYEEEPVVAIRNFNVDHCGDPYSTDNPFPVQLSDGSINIENLHANVQVQLSHMDNDPNAGDVHDSVQVGDGVEIIEVNPDGSINVNVLNATQTVKQLQSFFNEAFSVPAAVLTTVITYTVPPTKEAAIQRIEVSGENIATYTFLVNGTAQGKKITYFSGPLNEVWEFTGYPELGYPLVAGDVVQIKVIHGRPFMADFSARIQLLQITP